MKSFRLRHIACCLVCTIFSAFGIGIGCLHGQSANTGETVYTLLDSANYYRLRNPSRTLAFAKQVLESIPEEGNEKQHIQALLHCANSEKMLQNFAASLDYCSMAIRLANQVKETNLQIQAYFMKASVFETTEQLDSAVIYHQKVIALNHPEAKPYFICNAYTNIGLAHMDLGNDDKAEEYLLKGVSCSKQDSHVQPFTLIPLLRFYGIHNNPKYLPYLDSLAMTDFYKNASPSSWMTHFDSFVFLDQSSPAEKEQKLREICNYMHENSSARVHIQFGLTLAVFLQSANKLVSVDSLLMKLLDRARTAGSLRSESTVLRMLYENSRKQGRLNEAIGYNERYIALIEQLNAEESRNMISELNVRFETAQKDHQIAQQETRLQQERRNRNFFIILAVLAVALAGMTFFYLRHRILLARRLADQRKLLHDQEITLLRKEKEYAEHTSSLEARVNERNRIARDLHDEVGSALSSIYVYASAADKAMEKSRDVAKDILQKISINTRLVMENMSDIVWAINTGMDGQMTLEEKLKSYGYELLTPLGINCSYVIDPAVERQLGNIEARKNVLLIAKESMNNIAKYSEATDSMVKVALQNGSLKLEISDNGKGFTPSARRSGNGLFNMQRRTEAFGGSFHLETAESRGTRIECLIPLTNISTTRIQKQT